MKITKVTPLLVNQWLYVKVETDEGITGLGESGAWGFLEASAAAVRELSKCIIGEDASQISYLWNYMYRMFHFRGAAIMGALSAIDIRLTSTTMLKGFLSTFRIRFFNRRAVIFFLGGLSLVTVTAFDTLTPLSDNCRELLGRSKPPI